MFSVPLVLIFNVLVCFGPPGLRSWLNKYITRYMARELEVGARRRRAIAAKLRWRWLLNWWGFDDLLVVMVWDGEDEAYPMPVLNTAQIEALEYAPLEVEPGMRLANVGMFNSRGSDVLIRMRSGLRLGISGRTQRGGEPVADMVSLLGVSEALNQMGC